MTHTLTRMTLLFVLTFLSACSTLIDWRYQSSVAPLDEQVHLQGLNQAVRIRHNTQGVALIEAQNDADAFFAWGYQHASERMNYMEMMRLTAQGRMSEMMGRSALDVDRHMRALGFAKTAQQLYAQSSDTTRAHFQNYADGVNAWLRTHQNQLPMDLSQAAHQPQPWMPEDSVLLFCLTNYGLSGNLHEEIASLVLTQKLGQKNLAWLFPTYADEALPFDETRKLANLDLSQQKDLLSLYRTQDALAQVHLANIVASNNWGISPSIQPNGSASILANDAHLPIGLPSLWSFAQIKTPTQHLAGASVAGLPLVVIGSNGKLAWSMTMVMGDTEDVFLEKLSQRDGQLHYLYQQKWLPVTTYTERFKVRGEADVIEPFYSTVHGVLLNPTLHSRPYALQPIPIQTAYGIALQTLKPSLNDKSIDAQIHLGHADTVAQAIEHAKHIESLSVNVLLVDKAHIGWQLTGRYPVRKKGLGLLPSPGWTGDYDWQGTVDASLRPTVIDPPSGWLATANNRIVPRDYPAKFSNSFYHSERIERIEDLIQYNQKQADGFSFKQLRAMQMDQINLLAVKLQPYWQSPEFIAIIDALPSEQKAQAEFARQQLVQFDGNMDAKSPQAALFGLFIQQLTRELFQDELGEHTDAWQAMVEITTKSYSAQVDHLLGREDSPFWDNIQTQKIERKSDIMANSLLHAYQLGITRLGRDFSRWQWGQLHTYHWNSIPTQIAPTLDSKTQKSIQRIHHYLDRGPYPAGGDFNTINISSYPIGNHFDTTLIPSLRMIVDFNQDEPLWMVNNAGQSSNPASPFYANQIPLWRQGAYFNLPFSASRIEAEYGHKSVQLLPTEPKQSE